MKPTAAFILCVLVIAGVLFPAAPVHAAFTVDQVFSFPFPSDLVAARGGARVAWVVMEKGVRNVWGAEGPEWKARKLTDFKEDDGQELSQLAFTGDGGSLVFVRGGDHDSNWEVSALPNPASSAAAPKLEIWSVPFAGGGARAVTEGDGVVPSPSGDTVAFVRQGAIVSFSLAAKAPAADAPPLVALRGTPEELTWSPDGKMLAFVSNRGTHGLIALLTPGAAGGTVRYLAPSTSRDGLLRFSPDGKRIAFIRRPGAGGAPETMLDRHPQPWEIWVGDTATGEARAVWKSPATLHGSAPNTLGGPNLAWGAGDRLVFLANLDGWPHLYSIAAAGGEPLLLTPGKFMAEFVTTTPDGRYAVYNANTGPDADDDDRRHLFRVPVDTAKPEALTSGAGIEWFPTVTGDGRSVVYFGSGVQRVPLPSVVPLAGGTPRELVAAPAELPGSQLVVPRKIVFRAADGLTIHGQLFATPLAQGEKRPAVVYVHGGPPRQMLLGFHYRRYYANAYAMNQYLASRGFIVLAVNYRLGIGYGYDFKNPEHAGPFGASEYQDVLAAGKALQALPGVDPERIGLFGGSYGGFLTAMALARNSDVFKAGVDWHGVHDWTTDAADDLRPLAERFEKPADWERVQEVFWKSSPVADIATWKSPVLLIHGDDDRNVRVGQTVDLARRLQAAGVRFEEILIPDEIHDFLRHASWLKAEKATAEFLERELKAGGGK